MTRWTVKGTAFGVIVLVALGVATVNPSVQAAPVSLAELFAGETITSGDKVFTDWILVTNTIEDEGPGVGAVDTENVQVTAIWEDTSAPGLLFESLQNELRVSGQAASITLEFDFLVTSLGQPIVDNELDLTGYIVSPTGEVQIGETIGTLLGADDLGSKFVFAAFDDNQLSDSAAFAPQQSLWVRKTVQVFTTGPGTAQLQSFEQRFSQVPVPGSAVMCLGLLGTFGAAAAFKRCTFNRNLAADLAHPPHEESAEEVPS